MKHVPEHASLSVSVPAGGCGWLPYWDGVCRRDRARISCVKIRKKKISEDNLQPTPKSKSKVV